MSLDTKVQLDNECGVFVAPSGRCSPKEHQTHHNIDTSQGASSCNTAPYKYNNNKNQYIFPLRSAIDSLYLSFKGILSDKSEKRLQELKDIAQDKTSISKSESVFRIFDHHFEVKAKGSGKFAFVLEDNWFRIEISSRTAKNMPLAYAQIRSELLTFNSLKSIIDKLTFIVEHIGKLDKKPTISRLDICLDFSALNEFSFQHFNNKNWRSKAHLINSYWINNKHSGFSIGKGQVVGRIYNKLLEIKTSRKDYLLELWKAKKWDGISDVWRVEFQFRREFLQSVGILHIQDYLDRQEILWNYATTQWLQLIIPNIQDSNSSRWPVHPAWEEISRACLFDSTETLKRVSKKRLPSDQYLFINGLAVFSSFMAREGITDVSEAIMEYLHEAKNYHATYRDDDLKTYLITKAKEKSKRFNIPWQDLSNE
ncbi:MAG: replication initiation factor [gamma proteobacterium symbiont of Taylorina sp.]|nr:replication initiation factor [gamma proteobacterium symbiont of Taylorina sp.]